MAVGPTPTFASGVTGTGMSAFTAFLKENYEQDLNEEILTEGDTLIAKLIGPDGRQKMMTSGQRKYFAWRTQFPNGVGSRREGATLPFPYSVAGINPVVPSKDYYGTVQFTGKVERATKDEAGAFVRSVTQTVKDLRRRIKEDVNRKIIVGRYDILGEVSNDPADTALTVQSAATRSSSAPWRFGTKFLRHNTELAACAAPPNDNTTSWPARSLARTGDQGSFRVADTGVTFSLTTTAVTLAAAPAAADIGATTDLLIGIDTRPISGGDAVTMVSDDVYASFSGLMEIVDDGNLYRSLYSINRTVGGTSALNALRLANAGTLRPISEALIQTANDRVYDEGPSLEIDCMITGKPQRYRLAQIMTATRQFMSTDGKNIVRGMGFGKNLSYTGGGEELPILAPRDFPPRMLMGIRKPSYWWLYESTPGFLEFDGNVRRFVSMRDQTVMHWHMDGNMYCDAPNANFVIEDLDGDLTDYTL